MSGEQIEDTGAQSQEAGAAAAAEAAAHQQAIETEAGQYGWAPRDKWRGPADAFIEAGEFLQRAHQHLPIVKSQLKTVNEQLEKERAERKRLDAQYAAQLTDLQRKQQEAEDRRLAQEAEMDRQLRAQSAAHAKMMDLQRRQLIESTELEKRKALMIEDPAARAAAYDAVSQREQAAIRGLMEAEKVELPPATPAPAASQSKPSAQSAYTSDAQTRATAWLERNPWLRDNPALMRVAGQIEIPALPTLEFNTNPEAHLDYIKSQMKSWGIAVPDEGNPAASETTASPAPAAPASAVPTAAAQATPPAAAPRGSPVEGASRRGVSSAPKERGFKELPAIAKATCEDLISKKRLKGDPEAARKAYAAEYWAAYGEE